VIGTDFVLVASLAVVAWLHGRGNGDVGRTAARAIFAVYLVGVAHYALLPIRYDPTLASEAGAWIPQVGLHPFFLPGGDTMSRDQLFYNFLLGIPFGIGLPFVRRMSLVSIVMTGIAFAFAIEGLQLIFNVTSLALPPWTIDINDVVLNAAGTAFGAAVFGVARIPYRAAFGGLGVRLGVWRHFHAVLTGSSSAPGRA
jgi:glycopeptide antibiotics resistance protein